MKIITIDKVYYKFLSTFPEDFILKEFGSEIQHYINEIPYLKEQNDDGSQWSSSVAEFLLFLEKHEVEIILSLSTNLVSNYIYDFIKKLLIFYKRVNRSFGGGKVRLQVNLSENVNVCYIFDQETPTSVDEQIVGVIDYHKKLIEDKPNPPSKLINYTLLVEYNPKKLIWEISQINENKL